MHTTHNTAELVFGSFCWLAAGDVAVILCSRNFEELRLSLYLSRCDKSKRPSVCALLTNQKILTSLSLSKQLYHTTLPNNHFCTLTNHPPIQCPSQNELREVRLLYYFVQLLFVLYLFTSSELRACIHSKVTYVKRSPPADLALKTFILIKS